MSTDFTAAEANTIGEGRFPGLVGLRFLTVEDGHVRVELVVQPHHLAPNGYLHAAVVVAMADTACGYGVRTGEHGTERFTTLELKTNFVSTALDGIIECDAVARHRGRTTEIWDATVTQGERTLAVFRCTQLRLSS